MRYSRRSGLLYRVGDLNLPLPIPQIAAQAAFITLPFVVVLGAALGVPFNLEWGLVFYATPPIVAGWGVCNTIQDGKLGHEFLASKIARLLRRLGHCPDHIQPVRPERIALTTASIWSKDQP